MRYCSIEGCGKPAYCRVLCKKHYDKWYHSGGHNLTKRCVRGICTVDGCDKSHYCHGYCQMHFTRVKKYGDPAVVLSPNQKPLRTCAIEGCNSKHFAREWCKRHYYKWYNNADPMFQPSRREPVRHCSAEGCTNTYSARGYCDEHYQDLKATSKELITKIEKHGLTGTPTYRSWQAMIARCVRKDHKAYKDYGGRGIVVSKRWRYSFMAFYEDMGPRPLGKTLNRIDNDGNYEPGNCNWATPKEQRQNQRKKIT